MPAQPRRAAHQIGAIFSPSLQRLTSAEQWWLAWGTHLREHVLAGSQGDDGESAPKLQGREVAVLGSTWSSSWVSGPGGKVVARWPQHPSEHGCEAPHPPQFPTGTGGPERLLLL